jgi:D-alanine--poly(phosphoribitol) ligase subunit 2
VSTHEDLAVLGRLFTEVTGTTAPAADADLIDAGLLDSLALVELLFAIEQELGTQIPPDRLEIDRFRTLERLAALVTECRTAAAGDAA